MYFFQHLDFEDAGKDRKNQECSQRDLELNWPKTKEQSAKEIAPRYKRRTISAINL